MFQRILMSFSDERKPILHVSQHVPRTVDGASPSLPLSLSLTRYTPLKNTSRHRLEVCLLGRAWEAQAGQGSKRAHPALSRCWLAPHSQAMPSWLTCMGSTMGHPIGANCSVCHDMPRHLAKVLHVRLSELSGSVLHHLLQVAS